MWFHREHEHNYHPVAVEHRVQRESILLAPTNTATVILWRCDCEAVYSQEIKGRWTLPQIRGEQELTARERIETDLEVAAAREGARDH